MSTHDHEFPVPEGYVDPLGRPVDAALLGRFIGAAFDGCTTCQDAELTLVVADPATCARLIELACVTVDSQLGGLPASMTDPAAPGVASPEFRELARAGLDGANSAMFDACAAMRPTARRKGGQHGRRHHRWRARHDLTPLLVQTHTAAPLVAPATGFHLL